MYALVKEILDTSKEKKVDVVTARDMVIATAKNQDKTREAYSIISKYYDLITFYRRNDDEAGIKNVCALYEANNTKEIDGIINKLKKENKI